MAHFAKIENEQVVEIIVAEQDFIDSYAVGEPYKWIQASYNTRGGVYYKPNSNEPDEDQSKALRKNYPGVGFTYDRGRDAFIPPKPEGDGWVLNPETCLWERP